MKNKITDILLKEFPYTVSRQTHLDASIIYYYDLTNDIVRYGYRHVIDVNKKYHKITFKDNKLFIDDKEYDLK